MSAEPSRLDFLRFVARTATGWLIAINVAVFAAIALTYGYDATDRTYVLAAFGGKWNLLIQAGEVWRLVSMTFLHAGAFHLLLNMYALLNLGIVLEVIAGSRSFLVIYAVSGLTAALASYRGTPELSVGASGAIFGLGGALLVMGYLAPDRVPPPLRRTVGRGAIPFVVVNIALGFSINRFGSKVIGGFIDNQAHLGGLAGGALSMALLLFLTRFASFRKIEIVLYALAVLSQVWGLGGALRRIPDADTTVHLVDFTQQVLRPFIETVDRDPGARATLAARAAAWPPFREPALEQARREIGELRRLPANIRLLGARAGELLPLPKR